MNQLVVCFDLDDTLYKEIDFVKSAYEEIAVKVGHPEAGQQMLDWYHGGKNAFAMLINTYGLDITISECLQMYRNHFPNISLDAGVKEFFDELKEYGAKLGLITDGRSITQRNKIRALGLEGFFDIEIISEEFGAEKPDLRNYQVVMDKFPERKYFIYVGDNPAKDFIAPNKLGWDTFCLKHDKRNIHPQTFSGVNEYMPHHVISRIQEIRDITIRIK